MSIALNVEREFVVFFADYDTFEIRTLQSFESFDQQVDDLRIDKSIRFVVRALSVLEESKGDSQGVWKLIQDVRWVGEASGDGETLFGRPSGADRAGG
jgi:hypothetical protein